MTKSTFLLFAFATACFTKLLLHPELLFASEQKMPRAALMQYRATYILNWKSLKVGVSTHIVRKIGRQRYLAEVISRPYVSALPFSSTERSEFIRKNNTLQPVYYEYATEEKGRRKGGQLSFDWQHKKIKVIEGSAPPDLNLPDNAQDKITENLQLRLQLQEKKSKEGDTFSYTVVERNRIKTYTFTVLGYEKLETPLGSFDTVKLEHISDNKERKTLLWLAKDQCYLLVKLQHFRKQKLFAESVIQMLEPI